MECIAVFSGRSAGKGKDGVGGGLSTLSRMAVVGHGDVLVSASGSIQRTSWHSTAALTFRLHSALHITADNEAATIKY